MEAAPEEQWAAVLPMRSLVKRGRRREGSLAAALLQSMALSVAAASFAYPSWVLVSGKTQTAVLGATWALSHQDPLPGGLPLLGPSGGPLMVALASCCLLGAVSSTLALVLDFLGLRGRAGSAAPGLHSLAALLAAATVALGVVLLLTVRGQIRTESALQPLGLAAGPGLSVILAGVGCLLAAAAAAFSCSARARALPSFSWDTGGEWKVETQPPAAASEEAPGGAPSKAIAYPTQPEYESGLPAPPDL